MSPTEDTPGTSTDPALGSEGDSDQLTSEDSLEDRGVADLLDEGYSPPDRPRGNHWGETAYEAARGESLAQHLAQEEPEIWAPGGERAARQTDRAGRLADVGDSGREQDSYAQEVGLAGGAASAEEAAMHIIDPDDPEYASPEVAEEPE